MPTSRQRRVDQRGRPWAGGPSWLHSQPTQPLSETSWQTALLLLLLLLQWRLLFSSNSTRRSQSSSVRALGTSAATGSSNLFFKTVSEPAAPRGVTNPPPRADSTLSRRPQTPRKGICFIASPNFVKPQRPNNCVTINAVHLLPAVVSLSPQKPKLSQRRMTDVDTGKEVITPRSPSAAWHAFHKALKGTASGQATKATKCSNACFSKSPPLFTSWHRVWLYVDVSIRARTAYRPSQVGANSSGCQVVIVLF